MDAAMVVAHDDEAEPRDDAARHEWVLPDDEDDGGAHDPVVVVRALLQHAPQEQRHGPAAVQWTQPRGREEAWAWPSSELLVLSAVEPPWAC